MKTIYAVESRAILHMDLDTFYISVERLLDSRLNGLPILLGGVSDRGVVASCSYESRSYGVHSGMPMKMARQLCPEAIVIKGNAGTYTKYSKLVTDIIRDSVPVVEKASIDEFYADLSGMDKYFGCYRFATELRKRITRESGLPISFGLAENKTVSKIATGEVKPNNQIQIDAGKEKTFLAPLSVRKIPMVGGSTYRTFRNLGVRYIRTIQEMNVEVMQSVFGKNGVVIWKRANAIDNRPIVPFTERKSISTERTFDRDTIDVRKLKTILTAMAENLAYQLRVGRKLTSCVTVKIRFSDFNTYSKQCKIPYSSLDHILIGKVLELFDALYKKRLLVRLIGIRFSDLVNGNQQLDLFNNNEKKLNLYNSMDFIRSRYGERSIYRASTAGVRTIGRFHNPFSGEPPVVLAHRKQ